MINAIYGTKIGMTQLFDEDGQVTPVTVIKQTPTRVCQVKTAATDGYEAVQLGFGTIKEKKVNKPMAGHFAKQGVEPVRHLREVRVEDASEHAIGEEVTVAAFAEVKKVDVTGTSKGKGFAGVMRRYNFAGALADTVHTSIVLPVPLASAHILPRVFKGVRFLVTWVAIPLDQEP